LSRFGGWAGAQRPRGGAAKVGDDTLASLPKTVAAFMKPVLSRNENDFSRYPGIAAALANLPDDTVVDGEIVAIDPEGRPSFNALQNYGSDQTPLIYYLLDAMVLNGRDLHDKTLEARRKLLDEKILPFLAEPIRASPVLAGNLDKLIGAVIEQGLKGPGRETQ
jgi:ATP-dependent DNA ligase